MLERKLDGDELGSDNPDSENDQSPVKRLVLRKASEINILKIPYYDNGKWAHKDLNDIIQALSDPLRFQPKFALLAIPIDDPNFITTPTKASIEVIKYQFNRAINKILNLDSTKNLLPSIPSNSQHSLKPSSTPPPDITSAPQILLTTPNPHPHPNPLPPPTTPFLTPQEIQQKDAYLQRIMAENHQSEYQLAQQLNHRIQGQISEFPEHISVKDIDNLTAKLSKMSQKGDDFVEVLNQMNKNFKQHNNEVAKALGAMEDSRRPMENGEMIGMVESAVKKEAAIGDMRVKLEGAMAGRDGNVGNVGNLMEGKGKGMGGSGEGDGGGVWDFGRIREEMF
jgi:hypothetical protein